MQFLKKFILRICYFSLCMCRAVFRGTFGIMGDSENFYYIEPDFEESSGSSASSKVNMVKIFKEQ